MGMYTELHFNVDLKKDTPGDVLQILKHMLDNTEEMPEKPNHPLFKTDRWDYMLTCDSYYFDAQTHSTLHWDDIHNGYYLNIKSNLKNYDSEIEKFIDWVMPYVETYGFCGFCRYEQSEAPTLIYSNGKCISTWDLLPDEFKG